MVIYKDCWLVSTWCMAIFWKLMNAAKLTDALNKFHNLTWLISINSVLGLSTYTFVPGPGLSTINFVLIMFHRFCWTLKVSGCFLFGVDAMNKFHKPLSTILLYQLTTINFVLKPIKYHLMKIIILIHYLFSTKHNKHWISTLVQISKVLDQTM